MVRDVAKELDPRVVLKRFVDEYPTHRRAAEALHISQAYLCDLLAGHRSFSDRLLALLGLRRIVVKRG